MNQSELKKLEKSAMIAMLSFASIAYVFGFSVGNEFVRTVLAGGLVISAIVLFFGMKLMKH